MTIFEQNNVNERLWIQGRRSAFVRMLHDILKELGYHDDPDAAKAAWVTEREAAIVALRSVCGDYGDNEWDENLHLADIIEKHLERHLPTEALQ